MLEKSRLYAGFVNHVGKNMLAQRVAPAAMESDLAYGCM